MSNTIRAPFPWFGGKGNPKIKNLILQNLPPHTRYIEPFGGGGSILISKAPAEVEVYNDVNRGVVNFFRVIADVDVAQYLWRAEKLSPLPDASGTRLVSDGFAVRTPDGLAGSVEPVGAVGNGQVPAVAAVAWRLLTGSLIPAGDNVIVHDFSAARAA